ncbi:MAG: ABC transporter ATP-binding protein [Kiritimatiellae bacterium]|nr:ABC transporter ATP-binding protein [Kiritimatiellia bacterium]
MNLLVICWLIGMFLPICQSFIEPMALKSVTDVLAHCKLDSASHIVKLMLLFLCAVIGNVVARTFSSVIRGKLSVIQISDWTIRLMKKILFTRNDFLLQNEPEKVVRRISRDTETATTYNLSLWVDAPLAVLGLIISVYLMYFGSPYFLESNFNFAHQQGNALLASVIIGMTPLHLLFLLGNRKVMSIDQRQADASEKEFLVATETLRGVADIRASYSFPFAIKRLIETITPSRDMRIRLFTLHILFGNLGGLVWGISQFTVLSVAACLIFHEGNGFAFSDYMGFSALCGAFNMSMVQVVEIVLGWQKSRKAILRLKELEALPDSYGHTVGRLPNNIKPRLALQDVQFALSDKVTILKHISISVEPGEHIAIVGPSGCGKSTLLRLIIRHLTPTFGAICLGGENIEEINFEYYTRHVAYVSQKPFIFQGTIRDNIFVGRNLCLGDKQLKRILDSVALTDDLLQKDEDVLKALDYGIGADGQGISGGQASKIALARALVGNPDVVLLDEVTAPLDELSQDRVMRMFDEECRDKTIIFISHRLSAVRNMHRIIVMESGHIAQEGAYNDLATKPGLFASLVSREQSGVT